MVSIRGSQSLKNNIALICSIISIIIPQEYEIRTRGDQHPAVPKFKPQWIVYLCEFNYAVGFAVVIVVWKNKQGVIHFLHRFPHWIGRPNCGPKTTLGVNLHLYRVD